MATRVAERGDARDSGEQVHARGRLRRGRGAEAPRGDERAGGSAFAAQRPAAPAALRQPTFLHAIYERAVDQAEEGPVAEWLDAAPAPADLREVHGAERRWEDSLSESGLARELVQRPASPSPEAWSGVRRNVLDAVAHEASARRRGLRGWRAALAGAAAAAILAAISVSDGTPDEPRIVFTELSEVPDVPFAIVRYGARD